MLTHNINILCVNIYNTQALSDLRNNAGKITIMYY